MLRNCYAGNQMRVSGRMPRVSLLKLPVGTWGPRSPARKPPMNG